MKRNDTMSLGELRELIKDMPDDAVVMVVSEIVHDEALAVHSYPFTSSLDDQGVLLLEVDTTESVKFTDC